MSDTGTDITSETGIDVEPRPRVTTVGDSFSLPSTYQFPARQVVPSTSALVNTDAGLEQGFFKPAVGPVPVGQDKFLLYEGPRLVNERGVITNRGVYDPDEAYGILASIKTKAERMTLQNELYARGLYGGSKPSVSGFDSQDIRAMEQYLLLANRFGVTADSLRSPALAYLRSEYPVVEKAGVRVRVSSKEDISEVLRGESLRLLGRAMTPAEVRDAVSYVQQSQTTKQLSGRDVPALSTLGELAVGEGRESEMQVQGAARAASVLERLLGR
jgi:hypothetical protein